MVGISAARSREYSHSLCAATEKGQTRLDEKVRGQMVFMPEYAHKAITVSGTGFGDAPVTLDMVTWGNWAKT